METRLKEAYSCIPYQSVKDIILKTSGFYRRRCFVKKVNTLVVLENSIIFVAQLSKCTCWFRLSYCTIKRTNEGFAYGMGSPSFLSYNDTPENIKSRIFPIKKNTLFIQLAYKSCFLCKFA